MIYKLFTDGGARGNPGPSGIGMVFFGQNGELLWLDSAFISDATNNHAEYMAIYEGLKAVLGEFQFNKDDKIICYLDSELIVKQLNGEYKVKDMNLRKFYNKIQDLLEKVDVGVDFVHVRREENKFADKLVNISLDAAAHEKS